LGVGSWEFKRIAVVGRGLIGGSIELALSRLSDPPAVAALDREDDLCILRDSDLVILAAPVSENIRLLAVLPKYLAHGTLITDTSSTKERIVEASAALPSQLHFIGGHPVAGAAASGRAAARPDLFDGKPWIFTPGPAASVDDLDRLQALVTSIGATPHVMGPAEHDRLFAFTSHLPQLAASALMHAVGEQAGDEGLRLAGSGLRDSTRLASSPAAVWRDIVETNRSNINSALDQLIAALERIRADNGTDEVQAILSSAAEWKSRLH
jgi:prephenate dehydrogenase